MNWYSKEGARVENTSPEVPEYPKASKGRKRVVAGWPTLHVLLLDRLYAVFSELLFLHDCLSYVPTLLGNGRLQHHRHCDPPRRSIDSTVLYAAFLLRVSTALEYDKRIAYS